MPNLLLLTGLRQLELRESYPPAEATSVRKPPRGNRLQNEGRYQLLQRLGVQYHTEHLPDSPPWRPGRPGVLLRRKPPQEFEKESICRGEL